MFDNPSVFDNPRLSFLLSLFSPVRGEPPPAQPHHASRRPSRRTVVEHAHTSINLFARASVSQPHQQWRSRTSRVAALLVVPLSRRPFSRTTESPPF